MKMITPLIALVLLFSLSVPVWSDGNRTDILYTPEMKSPVYGVWCTIVNVHPRHSMDMKVEVIEAYDVGGVSQSVTCENVPPLQRCEASWVPAAWALCRFTVKKGNKRYVRAAIQAESEPGETAALRAW